MLHNHCPIPGYFAGSVIVGFNDGDADRVVDQIRFRVPDIEPHPDRVVARHERQARDVANEDLGADALAMGPIRLEAAMSGEHPVAKNVIEAEADIET